MKKRLLEQGYLLFDGAMGTMLQKNGLSLGEIPEEYNIEKPEIIRKIHKSYIDAGADILTTNTFGANEIKLKSSKYSVEEIIKSGVEIAKSVSKNGFVALDIGPIGELMEPMGLLDFEKAYNIFKRQVLAGVEAGCDLIIIETISDLYEAKAAILAAKENSNLPVICTMTFEKNERTFSGNDIISTIAVLEGLNPFAIGFNCSAGPDELLGFSKKALNYSLGEFIVQPNAGIPEVIDGQTIYKLSPDDFAQKMMKIKRLGVNILGGCCGSEPEHIKRLKEELQKNNDFDCINKTGLGRRVISSGTNPIILDNEIYPIGERINPTGNKQMKEALLNEDYDYILKEVIRQQEEGAVIIDVNLGLPQIDEINIMNKTIRKIQSISNIAIQIDSSNPRVIEEGLRIIRGNAIVNSVNGKEKSMNEIFPLIKKYGAFVIGLTLDENGIPGTCEERVAIARKILDAAKKYQIDKDKIIIDPLVLTASTQQAEVVETLKAIRIINEELELKTALGVSNVSFGLPNRRLLNQNFLAGALASGLNFPIVNLKDNEMIDVINSFKVIRGIDKDSLEYIKKYSNLPSQIEENTSEYDFKTSIIKGMSKDAIRNLNEKIDQKEDIMEIINKYIIPALDIVGERYEKAEIFLPQLIRSAEVAKECFSIIKSEFSKEDIKKSSKGKIILATVKGDVHDIGKNIVRLILENYGYEIIDLGKDVDEEEILKVAIEKNVSLVGLSALMTTTVKSMENTIKLLNEKLPNIKIFVGGAVLTKDYAKTIGADFYAKDAKQSIEIAQKFFAEIG